MSVLVLRILFSVNFEIIFYDFYDSKLPITEGLGAKASVISISTQPYLKKIRNSGNAKVKVAEP